MRSSAARSDFDAGAAFREYTDDLATPELSINDRRRAEFAKFLREEPLQDVVRVELRGELFSKAGEFVCVRATLVLACGHTQLTSYTPDRGPARHGRCPHCYHARISQRARQVSLLDDAH